MIASRYLTCLILTGLLPVIAQSVTAGENDELAVRAHAILKDRCHRCHGVRFEAERLNVLKREVLLQTDGVDADEVYVVPGKPDDSLLWKRMGIAKDMPPENSAQPTAEELELLKQWIIAGAPMPSQAPREFLDEEYVLTAIRNDLRKLRESDRNFARYFSLANLHNNLREDRVGRRGTRISHDELRLARAALSKLVNSLSWEPSIVIPEIVDAPENAVVMKVDLRDLGWHRDDGEAWNEIVKRYPYGVKFIRHEDSDLAELASEVDKMINGRLPYLRVDWFVDTASRPPLYERLLELPEDIAELEEKLNVDAEDDFLRNRLARAGFAESGVSKHNRLVDRHPSSFGYYWKSYDFGRSEGRGNLFRFPLGPEFDDNPFPEHAFQADGGEMIFSLPNGLQGYYLADGKGKALKKGPINVVRDLQETAGTAEVVNGISCMACHARGMRPVTDTILKGQSLAGDPLRKVQDLFPEKDKMDELIARDSEQFTRAVTRAMAPFLQVGEDRDKPVTEFPEPILATAQLHQKDLELEEVAAELGIADPQRLMTRIDANPFLKRRLGLGPLTTGAAIKRSTWAAIKDDPTDSDDDIRPSFFHLTTSQVDRGTPFQAF